MAAAGVDATALTVDTAWTKRDGCAVSPLWSGLGLGHQRPGAGLQLVGLRRAVQVAEQVGIPEQVGGQIGMFRAFVFFHDSDHALEERLGLAQPV